MTSEQQDQPVPPIDDDGRYEALARIVPVGIYRTDQSGNCIFVNQRWCDAAGLTAEQAMGTGWAKALHPDDRERVFSEWHKAAESQRTFHTICRFLHADGKVVWIQADATVEPDGHGYVGTVTDISSQKLTESAVKHIAAGVAAEMGDRFFQTLLAKLAELFDSAYAFIGLLDPNDLSYVETYAAFAHGAIVDNFRYFLPGTPCENVVGQHTCWHSSGVAQEFPDDQLLSDMGVESYIGSPMYTVQGEPLGLIVVLDSKPMMKAWELKPVLEIFAARAGAELERMRANRALTRSVSEWKQALDHFSDSVSLIDLEGRFIRANKAFYEETGLSPGDITGRDVTRLMHPDGAVSGCLVCKARLAQQDALITMESDDFYNPFDHPVEVAVKVIRDAEGKAQSIMIVDHDLRRQRAVEDELRAHRDHLEDLVSDRTRELEVANKELESFAYSVSHDLRAPLRAIDGFSQVLQEDYGQSLDETARRHLDRVRAASQRMGALIDDILKLSRVTRVSMARGSVDLSALAAMVVARLRELDAERQVEVRIEPGLHAPGDAALLEVVLENLIGNAWKYSSHETEARIEFGVFGEPGKPVYYVRDNGVGFDMRYANKLFGLFQRLHRTEEFEGTGVGLATVQRVVQRHQGCVWAESALGEGAGFYFTLGHVPEERISAQRAIPEL